MPDLFTNKTFLANNVGGARTPVSINFEIEVVDPIDPPPVVDPPPPPPVTNPDPGGPGGGTGSGGDIGNVDGTGVVTLGTAPTITRKLHAKDIFVARGSTMSVTYVASGPCTMLPKGGFPEMVISHSNNGQEMTITWPCPSNAAGDSFYIGCEVWVYGGDNQQEVRTLWDRLHVAKNADDIKTIGIGTSRTVLQDAIQWSEIRSGDTVIINSGLYNTARDHLIVGYNEATTNNVTPNGVTDGAYTVDLVGFNDATTIVGTEQVVRVSKYTVIMAAEPCSVVIDRADRDTGARMLGRYRDGSSSSSRDVFGIKMKGIALRRSVAGFSMARVDSCAYEWVSVMHDVNPSEYTAATGRAAIYQDGASFGYESVRNCHVDTFNAIYNNRFGVQIGGPGNPAGARATKHSGHRRGLVTAGCTVARIEKQFQTYTGYGGRDTEWLNCFAIDGAFFGAGIRWQVPLASNGQEMDQLGHDSFVHTNEGSDNNFAHGLLSLNTTTAGYRNHSRSGLEKNIVKESVFWDKKSQSYGNNLQGFSQYSMVYGGNFQMENVTIGKVQIVNTSFANSAYSHRYEPILGSSNVLVAYPRWNYTYQGDSVIGGSGTLATNFAFSPSESQLPPSDYLSDVNEYLPITGNNLKSSGFHYISRIEAGSSLESQNAGCKNLFAQVGSPRNHYLENNRTVYANVNWLSRAPWQEFQAERRAYSCASNGITFSGNVGLATNGVHPVDYVNRFGTSPNHSVNCPYIDDIYGKVVGTGAVTLWWRPVCAAYRSTISGYNIFVNGVKLGGTQPKNITSIPLSNITAGTRRFQVQVIDAVNGNSGLSKPIILVVT